MLPILAATARWVGACTSSSSVVLQATAAAATGSGSWRLSSAATSPSLQPPTHTTSTRTFATSSSSSSSSSSNEQQKQQEQAAGAPPLSKSFVAGKLSQEELWLAGLPGRVKIWAARTQPHLKVRVGGGGGGGRAFTATAITLNHKRIVPGGTLPISLAPAALLLSQQQPIDQGRESEVVEEVRTGFLELMQRHARGRILSHQARRQLKLACLSAATYDVLMRETGGDATAVDDHIRMSMGSLYAPFLKGSLKAVAWVKRTLFNEPPYKLALGTLKDIAQVGGRWGGSQNGAVVCADRGRA